MALRARPVKHGVNQVVAGALLAELDFQSVGEEFYQVESG